MDNFFLNQHKNQIKTFLKNTAFIQEFTKEIGFKIITLDPKFNTKPCCTRLVATTLLPERFEVSLVDVVHDDGGNCHDLS